MKRQKTPLRHLKMQWKKMNSTEQKLRKLQQDAKDLAWAANMLFNALHNRSEEHGNGE